MKKTLGLFSLILIASCSSKPVTGPDASTATLGNELRLPPEYTLLAPEDVETIRETPEDVKTKSKKILLKGEAVDRESKLNTWLLNKAGGQARVKNIKQVLEDDIKNK